MAARAPGDAPAAQDGRRGSTGHGEGDLDEQRAPPRLRDGARLPRAGVLRGARRSRCSATRCRSSTAVAPDRRAAEGLPARGAGGARPLPAAARAGARPARSAARARAGGLPRRSTASTCPTTSWSIRRRASTAASTSPCRSATTAARIPIVGPLEAPPLFSLTRSVDAHRRGDARRRGSTSPSCSTSAGELGDDRHERAAHRRRRPSSRAATGAGPVTVGAEVAFRCPTPAGRRAAPGAARRLRQRRVRQQLLHRVSSATRTCS